MIDLHDINCMMQEEYNFIVYIRYPLHTLIMHVKSQTLFACIICIYLYHLDTAV